MKALVLAEDVDVAVELCAGARTMANEVILVSVDNMEISVACADKIAHITTREGFVLDDIADTVIALFDKEGIDVVLAEPTKHLKTVVGKLAAHAKTSVITDVIEFNGDMATNMFFGGVAQKKQKVVGTAIYTVCAGVFATAVASGKNILEEVAWVNPANPLKLVETRPLEKSDVDLHKADIVVAAGRGFAEEKDLDLARSLCEKINAGLGCSRPLTEGVNWLPTEVYIGVSGLMISPKVYIAVGVSGQMQHMVGCNRSGVVFAINKDKNAPIFQQCDYGLIGDLNTVLPALTEVL